MAGRAIVHGRARAGVRAPDVTVVVYMSGGPPRMYI